MSQFSVGIHSRSHFDANHADTILRLIRISRDIMDREYLFEIVWGVGLGFGAVTFGLTLAWALG
jgi:hypothetical protein